MAATGAAVRAGSTRGVSSARGEVGAAGLGGVASWLEPARGAPDGRGTYGSGRGASSASSNPESIALGRRESRRSSRASSRASSKGIPDGGLRARRPKIRAFLAYCAADVIRLLGNGKVAHILGHVERPVFAGRRAVRSASKLPYLCTNPVRCRRVCSRDSVRMAHGCE